MQAKLHVTKRCWWTMAFVTPLHPSMGRAPSTSSPDSSTSQPHRISQVGTSLFQSNQCGVHHGMCQVHQGMHAELWVLVWRGAARLFIVNMAVGRWAWAGLHKRSGCIRGRAHGCRCVSVQPLGCAFASASPVCMRARGEVTVGHRDRSYMTGLDCYILRGK